MKSAIFAFALLFSVVGYCDITLESLPKASYISCAKVPVDVLPMERTIGFRHVNFELDRVCVVKVGGGRYFALENAENKGILYRTDTESVAYVAALINQGRVEWAPRDILTKPMGKIIPVYKLAREGNRIEQIRIELASQELHIYGFVPLTADGSLIRPIDPTTPLPGGPIDPSLPQPARVN